MSGEKRMVPAGPRLVLRITGAADDHPATDQPGPVKIFVHLIPLLRRKTSAPVRSSQVFVAQVTENP
jgi:hypothetical protein